MWLFHLHSTVKNRVFFQFSPRRDPRLRYFAGYAFGVSMKKASTIFYNTANKKGLHGMAAMKASFIKQALDGNARP